MPPLAVLAAKEAVNRAFELSLEAGLEFERRNFFMLFASEDQHEGMSRLPREARARLQGPLSLAHPRTIGPRRTLSAAGTVGVP